MSALAWILLLIIVAAALVVVAGVFYQRATNEVSLVKTGVGGRKVVIDGGTLGLPHNSATSESPGSSSGEEAFSAAW